MARNERFLGRVAGAVRLRVGQLALAAVLGLSSAHLASAEQAAADTDKSGAPAAEYGGDMGHGGVARGYRIETPSLQVRVFTPEASRKLKILPIPTSQPIPMIVGHYWRCVPAPEPFDETCRPVLVFCTDDQSTCVTTN